MSPWNLHEAAGALFREALARPAGEREELLAVRCANRPELLREVRSLLAHHREDSFLERPAAGLRDAPAAPPGRLPERVGPFRVVKLLGWGGAGVVYLATQDQPRRELAVKVLRSESARPEAFARFRRESEILARLDHPGIARVVEAGEAEVLGGTVSYIAMEYVAGVPLLEHARTLDRSERIELLRRLAEIVQHAHARGIVHRDLKPANVLVRPDGQPVVLDFGIARRTAGAEGFADEWTELAGETVTGELLGTLAYMSPEQAAGDASSVDAPTDVYALGVILYELLTGKLPHDTTDKLITEALRIIERGRPTPISQYGRQFGGDLETIVDKAMRREPPLRYRDAGELAEDLARLQGDRPILARPPGPVYRARKFLQRHRRLCAAAVGLFAVLLTALVASLSSLRIARAAEHTSRLEHAVALRFADSMLLDTLRREAEDLWPALPDQLPRFDRWLERADRLVRSRPEHARDAAGSELTPTSLEELRRLQVLVDGIDRFAGLGGELERIRERREFAATLEARTVDDRADVWAEAVAAIEDPARTPPYGGLSIRPQVGLVPLGPDPDSGLWEFGIYGPTGEVPVRDARTGHLDLDGEIGVVLVLIPGGEFLFGAQADDPDAPRYDRRAREHEGPPERVALAPFFLSKFEMNQAQWRHAGGDNPSYYAVGDRVDDYVFTERAPVESVSWTEAMNVLGRIGLTLPTEAQWEYAVRAGTDSVYWCGGEDEPVLLRSNLRDGEGADRRDGYRMHAPVGSFPPNAFGLHDMTGNVSEWCLDVFKVHCRQWPLREGDGLRLTSDGPERVRRGGAWTDSATVARSARRDDQLYYLGSPTIGVRPARALDR